VSELSVATSDISCTTKRTLKKKKKNLFIGQVNSAANILEFQITFNIAIAENRTHLFSNTLLKNGLKDKSYNTKQIKKTCIIYSILHLNCVNIYTGLFEMIIRV